ncbi:MAG: phosphoethanolamine transferase, partial [Methylophilales bacterium 16-45-9]
VSFSNVSSCGTSTGVSVPCMFSSLGRKLYDKEKALAQENALDVLAKNGIEVLWRDNNSDSKGVATRVRYEDFKTPTHNPVCIGECRDIGMLSGLDQFIAQHPNKDILIVLHQMGNHGPEYYRRYPKEFERFKPACQSGELRDCSKAEIDNAYDNAILYTDYFLSEVIEFLKKFESNRHTAMLYVADHGESLGEHGIYLHAAPYIIAPKEQTHIPVIAWFGDNFDYRLEDIKPYKDHALSHDDLFCTLLGAYEIDSHLCKNEHVLLNKNKYFKSFLPFD